MAVRIASLTALIRGQQAAAVAPPQKENTMLNRSRSFLATGILILSVAAADAAEPVDLSVVAQIREESQQRSEVANTLSFLSDVYGPRLTGTPRYLTMVEWTATRLGHRLCSHRKFRQRIAWLGRRVLFRIDHIASVLQSERAASMLQQWNWQPGRRHADTGRFL